MLKVVAGFCVLFLSACATITGGTTQNVTVSTDPPGASCKIMRAGEAVGAIPLTPGSVQISKSKNDIQITCDRPGYMTATISKSPSFGGATFGNIIAGGVIGVVVDAASGANYTYPSEASLALSPSVAPAMAAVQPTAPGIIPASVSVPPVATNKPIKG